MKAVVFKGVGNIALEEVKDPVIKEPTDAIIRLTRSAICGTDLHMIRGTMPFMKGKFLFNQGTILGHEGVGVVEKVGSAVKNFQKGDRVIIPSTIGCGLCENCQEEHYSQCNVANPHGPEAGTVFFGGPVRTGPLDGMQAEKVRVPYADTNLVTIPDDIDDDQAILLSDILPTAYMAVEMAQVSPDDTVAVFGCGPVGQLVIACLKRMGVTIFAIDRIPARLVMAGQQGAIEINFDQENPVKALKRLTNNKGPTKVIDAVGIDAEQPRLKRWDALKNFFKGRRFKKEVKAVAPIKRPYKGNWVPGNGPSQVLEWMVDAVAKNGTIAIVGVYTPLLTYFPIGKALGKNLTIRMGNCNHRAYIPELLSWISSQTFDPIPFITHKVAFEEVIDAYKHFDKRQDHWIKVVLVL